MSVLKIFLILVLLIPAGIIMMRTAADIRRDINRQKKKERAEAPSPRERFRVVK